MLEQMIAFLSGDEFRAWESERQLAYLREVYRQYRREFPDQMPMLAVLLAGMMAKTREQAQECAEVAR